MPDAMKAQQGFSLAEVLLSVVLMMMVISALSGGVSHLSSGFAQLIQYRQLWRDAWVQAQLSPSTFSRGGQLNRVQTSRQRCVSITATITTTAGQQGTLSRLHCPKS